jgi:uncharacterized surface protein with fasciclin (FAS1) repeats
MYTKNHKLKRRSRHLVAGVVGLGLFVSLPTLAQNHPNLNQPTLIAQTSTGSPATTANQPLGQLLQRASQQGTFNTLAQLVQSAGLTNALRSQGGNYTIFAPTDDAFAALPAGTLAKLQRPENRALLGRILAYHVVPQQLSSSQIRTGTLRTLGGGLAVRVANGQVFVNDGSVIQPDIRANNGVVHAVNRVLLPREIRQQLIALQ